MKWQRGQMKIRGSHHLGHRQPIAKPIACIGLYRSLRSVKALFQPAAVD
jgi:hypothetical protein